jgi:hypothetical protein
MESANYEDGPQGRGYMIRSLERANRSASQPADCSGNSVMFLMVMPAIFNESNWRLNRPFFIGGLADSSPKTNTFQSRRACLYENQSKRQEGSVNC